MWFYIIFKSAPISLICTFGTRKHCKLCENVKHQIWCKDKEIWKGALLKMKICDFILFLKVHLFIWYVTLEEENIVYCFSRQNTKFDVKATEFGRAHCKNENMRFILFLKVHLFLWYVPLKQENIVNCVGR